MKKPKISAKASAAKSHSKSEIPPHLEVTHAAIISAFRKVKNLLEPQIQSLYAKKGGKVCFYLSQDNLEPQCVGAVITQGDLVYHSADVSPLVSDADFSQRHKGMLLASLKFDGKTNIRNTLKEIDANAINCICSVESILTTVLANIEMSGPDLISSDIGDDNFWCQAMIACEKILDKPTLAKFISTFGSSAVSSEDGSASQKKNKKQLSALLYQLEFVQAKAKSILDKAIKKIFNGVDGEVGIYFEEPSSPKKSAVEYFANITLRWFPVWQATEVPMHINSINFAGLVLAEIKWGQDDCYHVAPSISSTAMQNRIGKAVQLVIAFRTNIAAVVEKFIQTKPLNTDESLMYLARELQVVFRSLQSVEADLHAMPLTEGWLSIAKPKLAES